MAIAVAAGSACTMKNQEAPPLTGPSEYATSVNVAPSPDILTQDGASQSVVTVTVCDANGQPLRNVSMRAEISVDGKDGRLRQPVGAEHRHRQRRPRHVRLHRSDPRAGRHRDQLGVEIAVTPIGTELRTTRTDELRDHPPRADRATSLPPSGLRPAASRSRPSAPAEVQGVFFDASASTSPATTRSPQYRWDFGDGVDRVRPRRRRTRSRNRAPTSSG